MGDSVVLKAEQRDQLTSRWDPHWEVTRINGPVVYIRNQMTGKYKPVNREKLRLVDPTVAWDDVNPRPRRQIRRPRGLRALPRGVEEQVAQPEGIAPEAAPPPGDLLLEDRPPPDG